MLDDSDSHKVKVAWDDICYPKEEGSLGFRRFKDTNRIFGLHLIWRLFTSKSSLWAKWARHYLLRNKSFWDVKATTLGSWIWKKILKLLPIAYVFLRVELGNGRDIHFWTDDWLKKGKLIDITGSLGTRYLGITGDARVCDAVVNGDWKISRRSRLHGDLCRCILAEEPPDIGGGEDRFLWRQKQDIYSSSFSCKNTWEQLRIRKNKISWSQVIFYHMACGVGPTLHRSQNENVEC